MSVMEKESRFYKIIDYVGLVSVGMICFLYSLYWSNFAEIHITLPFLDFPIFVGEILLFWCVCLLILKWSAAKVKFEHKYWLLLLYVAWVLFRALHGYVEWGPLALRNAALFYYPFFAVIGYHFYRRDFFNQKVVYLLFFAIVAAKWLRGEDLIYYFFPPYLILSVVLIMKTRIQWIKYFAGAILVCSFSYKVFFQGSRSYIIANFVIVLFLFLSYALGLLKFKKATKILGLILSFIVLIFIFLKFAPPEKVKSLTTPRYLIEEIRAYDQMIQENKKNYVPRNISAQVYNSNTEGLHQGDLIEQGRITRKIKKRVREIMMEIENSKEGAELLQSEEARESMYFRIFQREKERIMREVFSEKDVSEISKEQLMIFDRELSYVVNVSIDSLIQRKEVVFGRTMQTEYANILFRLFIWRDMFREVIQEKAWFGFSFGKPQRSVSLENSGFAAGEWGRDGWIAPHNAFFHMIYRAGVLGFFMSLGIFASIFVMIREFTRRKSLEGPLLVAVLIYWLVLSSFLVVLELPYQAIPFWTLFGMIFACLHKGRKKGRLGL